MNEKSHQLPLNKHKFSLSGSPKIVPFTGYGNNDFIYVSGLVVKENGISKPLESEGKWSNLISMIRRYTTNELENELVKVTFRGESKYVRTDRYGIYRCSFGLKGAVDTWQEVTLTLESSRRFSQVSTVGDIMVIAGNPEFGIISDIDDTILISYATQKLMKLRLMLLNNAHTRMPFEGVSAFYDALQAGSNGHSYNPIFYVSNSEWNLYDLLHEFIQFHRIPKGPMLLREMAIRFLRPWKIREVNRNHKMEAISRLFVFYPKMKFILIGDSGQKDPEVYSEIARQYPGRVPAIYIRDAGIPEKLARIKVLSAFIREESSTELVLVNDTEGAARHAIGKGFITPEYFEHVLSGRQKNGLAN